jgi:AcrR family transcriptional regulator
MARPRNHTHEDFLAAAMRIVDTEGLDALTFRRLGDEVGVSFTAVYTYYESRQDLVEAIAGRMVTDALASIDLSGRTPRERIIAMAVAVRNGMAKHPRAIPAFMMSTKDVPNANANMAALMNEIEAAGLEPAQAGIAYRVIESYAFGVTAFDFGAAPDHLDIRRRRYAAFKHPAFAGLERSKKAVGEHNDAAFLAGLERILDGFGI